MVSGRTSKTMGGKKPKELSKPELATPETKRVIIDALDKALRSIRFPAMDEARETLNKILRRGLSDDERGENLVKILGELSESDTEAAFRSAFAVVLCRGIDQCPEPTPEELKEVLEQLSTLPFEFRAIMEKRVKSIKRDLPHKPGGGRPDSLTLDQKKEACRQVGMLMGQGVLFRDALDRVGRQFGVGPRTIQRAWQKRAELYEKT